MHRFFIDRNHIVKDSIVITGDDASHISKVLRLKQDDKIVLCDGIGADYLACIDNINKHGIKVSIMNKQASKGEAGIDVTIYQGIPKSSKMDFVMQKLTEIGAKRIVPIYTKRTVVKLSEEKEEEKKVRRWEKIVEEAAKQSNRGRIPIVEMPISFNDAIEQAVAMDLSLIPYEKEKGRTLKRALKREKPHSIGVFIGPEGGFEPNEIQYAVDKGINPITLGNRILRSETAGFLVLSCIMYELDEL